MTYDDNSYMPFEDEGPEARLYREQAQWERFSANRVEILLSTIRPYDSIRVLWSFSDTRRWKFKRSHGQFDGMA